MKGTHYRPIVEKVIGSCLILAVLILLSWYLFPIREHHYVSYDALLKSSHSHKQENTLLSCSQHQRMGVCKHIWYQEDVPLYFRIDSKESKLFFKDQNHQIEVVEQMGQVSCIMQEELYFEEGQPMQKIRYLESEKANYNYSTQLFVAEEVKLWKYHLPGHFPPLHFENLTPLMQATAKSIEFVLKGEKLHFVAQHMKATFNDKERAL